MTQISPILSPVSIKNSPSTLENFSVIIIESSSPQCFKAFSCTKENNVTNKSQTKITKINTKDYQSIINETDLDKWLSILNDQSVIAVDTETSYYLGIILTQRVIVSADILQYEKKQ